MMSKRLLSMFLCALLCVTMLLPSATATTVQTEVVETTPVSEETSPEAVPTETATAETTPANATATDAAAVTGTEVPAGTDVPAPTEETTVTPEATIEAEATPEVTEEPVVEEPAYPPLSIQISINPMVAEVGDQVTLSATVSGGPEGKTYQWQWANIPEAVAEEAAQSAGTSDSSSGAAPAEQMGDGLTWNDASGATDLTYSFTASEETLNRYWRLMVWVPEEVDESEEEDINLLSSLRSFFVPTAHASGTTGYTTGGVMLLSSTGFTLSPSPGSQTIDVNKVFTLTITVKNASAGDTFTFDAPTVSDPTIIDVQATSQTAQVLKLSVTGLNPGNATISITATDDSDSTNFKTITVPVAVNTVKLTGIKLSATTNQVAAGSTNTIAIAFTPTNATNQTVTWTSSNTSVATVDASGVVTGVARGTATIRATAVENGRNIVGSISVTVNQPVTSLTFKEGSGPFEVAVNKTQKLTPVYNTDATKKTVTWTVSPPDSPVATVSAAGLVTGKSAGTVQIIATATDGSGTFAVANFTVTQPATRVSIKKTNGEYPTTIALDISNPALATITLNAEVLPDSTTTSDPIKQAKQDVVWSTNESYVSISPKQGMSTTLTALKNGSVTLTATTTDGTNLKATVRVTVSSVARVNSLHITGFRPIAAGTSLKLGYYFDDPQPSNKNVTWSSSDPNIASVSSNGTVTAKKIGTEMDVIITATAADGSGVYDEKLITITPVAEKVEILHNSTEVVTTMAVDVTDTPIWLDHRVYPADASQDVTWTSSNTRVATVDSYGVVNLTGTKGTVVITATAADGSKKAARCTITVGVNATDITITAANNSETVAVTKTLSLKATVLPTTATKKTVTWRSSDPDRATVSATGLVTGKSQGPVTIYATAQDSGVNGLVAEDAYDLVVTELATNIIVTDQYGRQISSSTGLSMDMSSTPSISFSVKVLGRNGNDLSTTYDSVTWTSSNSRVVSIMPDGLTDGMFVAAGKGTATITATAKDGSNTRITFKVTVGVISTGITITGADTLASGKTTKLAATVYPSTVSNKNVTWSVDNTNYATVSAAGVVTAKKVSAEVDVIVTATAVDGGATPETHRITISPATTGITFDPKTKTLEYGSSHDLSGDMIILPVTASDSVKWTSSNVKAVTVTEDGIITGIGTGKATITATATDGTNVRGTVVVTVGRTVTGVTISGEMDMTVKQTQKLTAVVDPHNATNPDLNWTSSDPAIATVNSVTGLVTAKAVYNDQSTSVTITATSKDGTNVDGTFVITIYPLAASTEITYEGVTVDPAPDNTFDVPLGQRTQLLSSVEPGDANQATRWASSNTKAVTITESTEDTCWIETLAVGTSTITCYSKENSAIKSTMIIKVYDPEMPTSVTIDNLTKNYSIGSAGDTFQIDYTVEYGGDPVDWPTDEDMLFTSSAKNVATVDEDGLITAVAKGTTTIVVQTVKGAKRATVQIKVN